MVEREHLKLVVRCLLDLAALPDCDTPDLHERVATVMESAEPLPEHDKSLVSNPASVIDAYYDSSNPHHRLIRATWNATLIALFSQPDFRRRIMYDHPIDQLL